MCIYHCTVWRLNYSQAVLMPPNLTVLRKQYPFKIAEPLRASEWRQPGQDKASSSYTELATDSILFSVRNRLSQTWPRAAARGGVSVYHRNWSNLLNTFTNCPWSPRMHYSKSDRVSSFIHCAPVLSMDMTSICRVVDSVLWVALSTRFEEFLPTDRVRNGRSGQSGKRRSDLPYHCSTFTRGFCVIHTGSRWIVISLLHGRFYHLTAEVSSRKNKYNEFMKHWGNCSYRVREQLSISVLYLYRSREVDFRSHDDSRLERHSQQINDQCQHLDVE